MDGGDDDGDSSGYDTDDEDEDDEDEEEEEHLASTDSIVVIPTDELVSLPKGTEPIIPPPFTNTATTGARITALARRRGIGEVRYVIRDTWIDQAETVSEIAPMTIGEVKLLMEDMIAHQETIQIVEDEAYAAREAWAHSIGLSQTVHSKLQTHQEHMQQTEIAELRETDRRRQTQMAETLRVLGDMRREIGDMQSELLAPRGQPRRVGQPGGDARVPNNQDAPRDAVRPSTLPNNTNANNMTPESGQAMIDQALLRNSTNRDERHGTKGVVGLTRWIEKMESVFQIYGCGVENQVKFATYTLLDAVLTWWNRQIRSLGPDAYSMTWEVKENNVSAYTERFQELTLICTKFVADETEKINKSEEAKPLYRIVEVKERELSPNRQKDFELMISVVQSTNGVLGSMKLKHCNHILK
nr:hypothetical protein [Tanacetum cinerariifolium]